MDNDKKMNANINIKDFILVEENFLDREQCANIIDYFHVLKSYGLSYSRGDNERISTEDESANVIGPRELDCVSVPELNIWLDDFNDKFKETYSFYDSKFDVGIKLQPHYNHSIKIQKTEPTEGYHVWHCENNGAPFKDRVCAWILYLNDVDEGGETEFLFQSQRVQPKMGTFVLWPAGYTHHHRGNPPLKGTKFIMTGWTSW